MSNENSTGLNFENIQIERPADVKTSARAKKAAAARQAARYAKTAAMQPHERLYSALRPDNLKPEIAKILDNTKVLLEQFDAFYPEPQPVQSYQTYQKIKDRLRAELEARSEATKDIPFVSQRRLAAQQEAAKAAAEAERIARSAERRALMAYVATAPFRAVANAARALVPVGGGILSWVVDMPRAARGGLRMAKNEIAEGYNTFIAPRVMAWVAAKYAAAQAWAKAKADQKAAKAAAPKAEKKPWQFPVSIGWGNLAKRGAAAVAATAVLVASTIGFSAKATSASAGDVPAVGEGKAVEQKVGGTGLINPKKSSIVKETSFTSMPANGKGSNASLINNRVGEIDRTAAAVTGQAAPATGSIAADEKAAAQAAKADDAAVDAAFEEKPAAPAVAEATVAIPAPDASAPAAAVAVAPPVADEAPMTPVEQDVEDGTVASTQAPAAKKAGPVKIGRDGMEKQRVLGAGMSSLSAKGWELLALEAAKTAATAPVKATGGKAPLKIIDLKATTQVSIGALQVEETKPADMEVKKAKKIVDAKKVNIPELYDLPATAVQDFALYQGVWGKMSPAARMQLGLAIAKNNDPQLIAQAVTKTMLELKGKHGQQVDVALFEMNYRAVSYLANNGQLATPTGVRQLLAEAQMRMASPNADLRIRGVESAALAYYLNERVLGAKEKVPAASKGFMAALQMAEKDPKAKEILDFMINKLSKGDEISKFKGPLNIGYFGMKQGEGMVMEKVEPNAPLAIVSPKGKVLAVVKVG